MTIFEPLRKLSVPRAPGIRGRLALTFGGISVLLSLCLALIIGHVSKSQLEANSGSALARLATQMARTLDRGMFERFRQLQLLADLDPVRTAYEPRSRQLFARVQETYPEYSWIGLTDLTGRVLVGSRGHFEGQDLSAASWYREGRRSPYFGNVHDAPLLSPLVPGSTGQPARVIDFAMPIHGPDGNPKGVLGAHLNWQWVTEILDSLVHEPEHLQMLVLSQDGEILLSSPANPGLDREALDTMRRFQHGYWLLEEAQGAVLAGFAVSKGHRSYPGLGWMVVVTQDAEAAFAESLALQRQIVLWGLALGVAFSLWGLLIAHRLAKPIRTLAEAANRVEQGERQLELPAFEIREFVKLSDSLTNMVSTLAQQERSLLEANENLERRVRARTSELQATEERFRQLAYRDVLTGLPNRLMFQEQLRQSMGYASQYGRKMAVMFLDLDRFKEINDTLGHDAGDLLLKQVAERLSASIRGGDMVARLAGDEFTVILNDVEDDSDVRVVAQRIVKALSEPFDLNGDVVETSASVGICLFPSDGSDVAVLLKKADVAMYLAKRQQNGYQFYAEAYEQARG
jgi:diguanylate cyclase (GGDEF)-like protein